MILIVGIKHSYTSVVAKFLYDNGVKLTDTYQNRTELLDWDKYEDKDVMDWYRNMKKGIKTPFPIKEGVAKLPEAAMYLDDIPKEVRLIVCLRNPIDVMLSHKEKYGRGHEQILNKYCYIWDKIASSPHRKFVLMTESLLNKDNNVANQLIGFCCETMTLQDIRNRMLGDKAYNFNPIKKRSDNYLTFRFKNTIFKFVNYLFKF